MTTLIAPSKCESGFTEARDNRSSAEQSHTVVNQANRAEYWYPDSTTEIAEVVLREEFGATSSQADLYIALITQWADAAMAHGLSRSIGDGECVATVAGIQGALGYGSTEDEALESLRSALADWVHVKLEHGDTDIPVLGGINFNPA